MWQVVARWPDVTGRDDPAIGEGGHARNGAAEAMSRRLTRHAHPTGRRS